MKVYKVKVNGKVYEVELEAVSESAQHIEATPAPIASAPVSQGAKTIVAPIAGKVLKVLVNPGDTIKANQNVAIVEAMKLENEIPAPCAGVVKEIRVKVNDSVNNGDVLIVLG